MKKICIFLLFLCSPCFGQVVLESQDTKNFYYAENLEVYGDGIFSATKLDATPRLGVDLKITSQFKEEPLVEAWKKDSSCDSIDLPKRKTVEGENDQRTHFYLLIGQAGETWNYKVTFYVDGKWIRQSGSHVFPGEPTPDPDPEPEPGPGPDKNVYTQITKSWLIKLNDAPVAKSLGEAYVNISKSLEGKALPESKQAVRNLNFLIMKKRTGESIFKPWDGFFEEIDAQFEKDQPSAPKYLETIKSIGQTLQGE